MSKYTFIDLVNDVFKECQKPLTPEEIWKYAQSRGWDNKLNSVGKTPWQTISAQLYVCIQKGNGNYAKFGSRPTKFGLNSFENLPEKETLTDSGCLNSSKKKYHERDLHKLLASYVKADSHFKCRTKTIYHEKSHKKPKGVNEWLHPDIVGVYFPYDDFSKSVIELFEVVKDNPYRLFSFEMKKELNYANLRESYFQAVSNSSWSHEGYLVAVDILDNDEFMEELSRLCNAFGIGIIKLNPKNISQSEIIFSAQMKHKLDWDTIERMAVENSDFKEFVDDVSDDYKTTKASSRTKSLNGKYDDYFENDEDAYEYARKNGII